MEKMHFFGRHFGEAWGDFGSFRGPLAYLAPLPAASDFTCFQKQLTNIRILMESDNTDKVKNILTKLGIY